jgi:putative ABC transport system substrate-binding protein
MDRRAFLIAIGAGIAVIPLVGEAEGQTSKVWRLGVLTTTPRPGPESTHYDRAFTNELRELGYREGQNLIIEWRYTHGQRERIRQEAAAVMP